MRTIVLSIAALAACAATADAQYVVRRGVVYGPAYPSYYVAPQFVAPQYVVPGVTEVVPASGVMMSAAPGPVVVPAPAVVGYGYYPAYRYGWGRWR